MIKSNPKKLPKKLAKKLAKKPANNLPADRHGKGEEKSKNIDDKITVDKSAVSEEDRYYIEPVD